MEKSFPRFDSSSWSIFAMLKDSILEKILPDSDNRKLPPSLMSFFTAGIMVSPLALN
jgi:hypothetical protein